MACLLDFLKCLPPSGKKDEALASPEFAEWQKLRKECNMMLERGYFHGGNNYSLSDPEKLVHKKAQRLLDAIWKQYQYIPSQMHESVLSEMVNGLIRHTQNDTAHYLGQFANSPRVELSDIREAATKLSYMILPISYLIEEPEQFFRQIEFARYDVSRKISDIKKYTEQDLYVLCPINFYDIRQAEKETSQREVIFGGELMQIKVLLDTITQIQRNVFAILAGNEADTHIWEIGEGCGCSETELTYLKMLVKTIMPIQRSLLAIARKSNDMKSWEEEMQKNHYAEMTKILQETSQRLSWTEEARTAVSKSHNFTNSWKELEAATTPDVLFFSLRHGTSLVYGNEPAVVLQDLSMDMLASFYLNRGFKKQSNKAVNINRVISYFGHY